MSRPRFDWVAMVDWSAASTPVTGADSVWWAVATREGAIARLENPPTRREAMDAVADWLRAVRASGERALLGFDFPFGYPAGVAARLGCADWRALWARLADLVTEGSRNATNRLDAAAALNAAWADEGPFWGNGLKRDIPGLPRKKPSGYGAALPSEWRRVERLQKARRRADKRLLGDPKSVWQLAGAGAVGSQALTGIAALERLRQDPTLRDAVEIWPLERGLAPPNKPICVAEVYPSLRAATPLQGEPKDAAQVRTLALWLAEADASGALDALFRGPSDLGSADRALAAEEAWILGVADAPVVSEAACA